MSTYHPDAWVIVELDSAEHGKIYKVLAGWYGGFTHGNSWKLSSGIESVTFDDEQYIMPQSSGSTYICHSSTERMSSIMAMTFADFVQQAEEAGTFTVKVIDMEELLNLLKATPDLLKHA